MSVTPKQLALGPDGDLLVVNGQLQVVTGPESVLQEIGNRCQMWRGEWEFDPRQGIPFRDIIFAKGTPIVQILRIFRQVILDTPGVSEVTSITADANTSRRELTIRASVRLAPEYGSLNAPVLVTVLPGDERT